MTRERLGQSGFRSLHFVVLALALALTLACDGDGPETPSNGQERPRSSSAPLRIVSTAPSLTETLFALGAGERVVGVTTWCRFPKEALDKPKIGGFATPSVEAIVALEPDLAVFVAGLRETAASVEAFGVPVEVVDPQDLAGIEDSIQRLAERLGLPERGHALWGEIEKELADVTASVAGRPRRRVLMVVGRSPGSLSGIYAVGPGSFIGELLDLAGGVNVFADSPVPYAKASLEQILARDPEVIIELVGMSVSTEAFPEQARSIRRLWGEHTSLTAVREDAVRPVHDDALFHPGPRVGQQARRMAHILHETGP